MGRAEASAAPPAEDVELREASRAYQIGNHETALRLLDGVLARHATSVPALLLKAGILRLHGHAGEALPLAQQAARLDPTYAVAQRVLAVTQVDLQDWNAAEQAARKAILLGPRDPLAFNALGLALQGRAGALLDAAVRARLTPEAMLQRQVLLEEASRQYETAVGMDPRLVEAHVNLGVVRTVQGRSAPARDALDRALSLDPRSLTALVAHGVLSMRAGDLLGASQYLEDALRVQSAYVPALVDLASVRYAQERSRDALSLAGRALELEPGQAAALVVRGSIRRDMGNIDAALKDLAMAVREAPADATARSALGTLYLGQGDAETARDQLDKAIQLGASDAATENNLGLAYKALARYQEARLHFEKALEAEPMQADIHYNLGVTLDLAGDPQGAVDHLNAYLRLVPNAPDAREIRERVKELQRR